jgi:diguanylate cyclase (GGDEF)-like protein/PAS domain S-box-containing protein
MNRPKRAVASRRVLYVGGVEADAATMREALGESRLGPYELEWVDNLADGLQRLASTEISVVLLDLGLLHGRDVGNMGKVEQAAPNTPILLVGSDADVARRTGNTAPYCLVKSRLDGYWLPRVLHDAIERRLTKDALLAGLERAQVTLNSIGEAVISTNNSGQITYFNAAAEALTSWRRRDAVGRPLHEVLRIGNGDTPGSDDPSISRTHMESLVSDRVLTRRDGAELPIEDSVTPIHDRSGLVTGQVTVLRDVSSMRATSRRMAYLANHDLLTGLPNRLLLADRLARALAMADRHRRGVAVLFLDVDRFKAINDSLGHSVGDELLHAVAAEIAMCVRSSDTVSRQGGDEFVVVLSELDHPEDAAVGAQKIVAAVKRPRIIAGHELYLTVSIGISVFPEDGHDAETLLRNADIALYHAKDQGRDRHEFFTPDMKLRAVERQSIEADLHRAVRKQEFLLHYQPKVSLKTGAICGTEALVRWQHPDRGLTEPAGFIPVAEECGLISSIDRWVVHEACRQARTWQKVGLPRIPVSVNVSAVEFLNKDFVSGISDILSATGLDPQYLEIELTESSLMSHGAATSSTLKRLKMLGVRLAIDDFGTGFSNLSYLNQFPIDALKIDKSFVHQITPGTNGAPIVSAVINMAKSLHHRVIAEGVETGMQLDFLLAEDCGEGQGNYFSPPVVPEQLAEMIATRPTWAS